MEAPRTRLKESIRELSIRRRAYGLTPLDRILLKSITEELKKIDLLVQAENANDEELVEDYAILEELGDKLMKAVFNIITPHHWQFARLPRIKNKHISILALDDLSIPQFFRFKSKEQYLD